MTRILNLSNRDQRDRLHRYIDQMNKVCKVTVKPIPKRRSIEANAYYWGVVIQEFSKFLKDQGEWYTDEEVHEMLKYKFLRRSVVNRKTGEVISEVTMSTAKLSTSDFAEYVDRCCVWLNEMFGIQVPAPQ